jgi:hypothetical protein
LLGGANCSLFGRFLCRQLFRHSSCFGLFGRFFGSQLFCHSSRFCQLRGVASGLLCFQPSRQLRGALCFELRGLLGSLLGRAFGRFLGRNPRRVLRRNLRLKLCGLFRDQVWPLPRRRAARP